MTITYEYENSLYVNITNRCSNACSFCIRTSKDGFYADDLWLEREPTEDEIAKDILSHDLTSYKQLVFCGYGEPTERLETMLNVCRRVKEASKDTVIRLNTNGHAELIYGAPCAHMFKGLIDVISISLNASSATLYNEICNCAYGEAGFDALCSFTSEIKEYVPTVVLSMVKMPDTDEAEIERCRELAEELGVPLRVRDMIK